MAIKTYVDSNNREITEIWGGAAGSPVLIATLTYTGLTLGEGVTLNGQLSSAGENADFLTVTTVTSVQTPLGIVGNADAATARTGGSVRAPNVVGATTNVAAADLTISAGLGHGSGTAGTILLRAADVAASGDNAQSLVTVGTLAFGGLTLAAAKTLTTPLAVVTTSTTCPLAIGGTAVGSDLVLQSTSGVGDGTDTVIVKVGNNGATTVASASATAFTLGAGISFVSATQTPASAGAAGVAGTITWDTGFLYVCTATNTWERVAIATW